MAEKTDARVGRDVAICLLVADSFNFVLTFPLELFRVPRYLKNLSKVLEPLDMYESARRYVPAASFFGIFPW